MFTTKSLLAALLLSSVAAVSFAQAPRGPVAAHEAQRHHHHHHHHHHHVMHPGR